MIEALIVLSVALAVAIALLAVQTKRLHTAKQPRKVLTCEAQPNGEIFLNPVVVLQGGNDFIVVNNGSDGVKRLAFTGVEANRWDIAINLDTATARVCCWLDNVEIWKPVDLPQEAHKWQPPLPLKSWHQFPGL